MSIVAEPYDESEHVGCRLLLAQRDATIAELRAEVERLKDDLRQAKYMEACARALMASSTEEEDANFERIVSERDALRASHERLRKALEEYQGSDRP